MKLAKQKIVTFLWFDDKAEEAAKFYTSIFDNSKMNNMTRYPEDGPGAEGSVMSVEFELDGQSFIALNGGEGPESMRQGFTPAISLLVNCETQEEVDELWEKLTDGGEILQCGWLTDKYGLTWQITPTILLEMNSDPDPVKARNVMKAMMKMKKIDIAELKAAYENA